MFASWLQEMNTSLAFTTYQAGRLLVLGVKENGSLGVVERALERSMGLAARGNSLYVSSLFQIWRFDNTPNEEAISNGFDACYTPRMSYVTGDLDVHDMAFDSDGSLVFVNTMFGCLAKPSSKSSFTPVWQPPFLTKLVAEDRCHLNGMASDEKGPAYVTAVSQSDIADGWRDCRTDGGCVIDVRTNEIVGEGFSMPHSPRLYAGKLWLLDSGNGYFGSLDPKNGHFEKLTLCPGYARGLSFIGKYAVIGLSLPRTNNTFAGLRLDETLEQAKTPPRCGYLVVDITTGEIVHWLRIEGKVTELYDVAILPGIRRPALIGFRSDDIRRTISIDPPARLYAAPQLLDEDNKPKTDQCVQQQNAAVFPTPKIEPVLESDINSVKFDRAKTHSELPQKYA